jgi:nicotinamidase-related amidase
MAHRHANGANEPMTDRSEYSREFLRWLRRYVDGLPTASLSQVIADAGGASQVWMVGVDLIKGFCVSGPLAGHRAAAIVEPCAALVQRAWAAGVRRVFMARDAHGPDAEEFRSWPVHCVAGTEESELVDELAALPMANEFRIVDKNSLSALQDTDLQRAIETDGLPRAVICIGDCTDLCTYNLAMGFRMIANARNQPLEVIVPADCVETYHLGVEAAAEIGALPHDGDLLHHVFLYHLALNGCRVVASIR